MKRLRAFFFMTLGSLLVAIGVYFFKIPNGFSIGGVSGLSIILGKVLPFATPASLNAILNVLLLVIGFFLLGHKKLFRTMYCSLLYAGLTWVFELVFPLSEPLTNQPFLELCYAILLSAIGSALLFYCNASSGGTDIVALILQKYTSINVGKGLLCVDVLVAGSAFFVFGTQAGLYSMLGLFAKSFLIDSVIENIRVCKSFTIVTDTPEPIMKYIIEEMHHSATATKAIGAFTHADKTLLLTMCRRSEAVRLKKKIHELDPHAFIIVQTANEIIGRGFSEA